MGNIEVRKRTSHPFLADLQNGPDPKNQAHQRDKSAAENLAILLKPAQFDILKPRSGKHTENHISRDGAKGKDNRHNRDQAKPILASREESRNTFYHG